jgi:reactive intermediate/imine deaminase
MGKLGTVYIDIDQYRWHENYPQTKRIMKKEVITTEQAPEAIGTYSQAIRVDNTVYLSGQIPLQPTTMRLVEGDIEAQISQVFENLQAVAKAAGGTLADIVKLNVYLTELENFAAVNSIMANYIAEPYPARAAIGVAALPKGAQVEMDAVLVLESVE